MLDNPVHVFAVNRNSVLGELVEVRWVKHVPLVLQTRNENPPGCHNATADATNLDFVEPLASSVGEAQEDETTPPFHDETIVSRRASHDRAEVGGYALGWPPCVADGNTYTRGK